MKENKIQISIDRKAEVMPTDYSWQFGIGNDHAFLLHRTDVCEHLKLAHDELGFRYLRCHGLFDDDMLTIQRLSDFRMYQMMPHAKDVEEINFHQVALVLDNILDCGMKPFVELSFMPSALASGKKVGLRYNNNITNPKSMKKWVNYIKKFISFLTERYGKEEIESWYFEVWNEPDLQIFFDGKQEDYFKLYEYTAKAVKEMNPNLRVGGPSSSACLWLEEFLAFCKKNDVPCDFVSTHHYPGDAFGNTLSAKNALNMIKTVADSAKNQIPLGECLQKMFYTPDVFKSWKKGALTRMDCEAKRKIGDKSLFVTEWNSMAVFASPVHDEKYSAAFVVKSCLDLKHETEGYMFWCCSDVYEEHFMLGKPFVGGFGIVSNDGIPKPNFWAFKMLSKLYPNRLKQDVCQNEIVDYAVFVEGNKTQVLICLQDHDREKKENYEIEVLMDGVASKVTEERIDDTHCNPKAEWENLGKPDYLSRKQVNEIKEKTKLVEKEISFEIEENKTKVLLNMKTNDVVLLSVNN